MVVYLIAALIGASAVMAYYAERRPTPSWLWLVGISMCGLAVVLMLVFPVPR